MSSVIDTNVLIFDTFEDSEHHKSATTKLDSLENWHLAGMVFHELAWFFKAREIPFDRARTKLGEYLTNEKTVFVPCTTDDILFATAQMRSYRKYNDLIILSVAKRLGQPLFTYDEDLRKIATRNNVPIIK